MPVPSLKFVGLPFGRYGVCCSINLLLLCEQELMWLDMLLNVKKSVCIRIGARFKAECCNLVTSEGQVLIWANDIRYLAMAFTLFHRLILNALWIMLNVPSIGPSMPFLGKLVESLLTKSLYS